MKKTLPQIDRLRALKFLLIVTFLLSFFNGFVSAQSVIVTGTENNIEISKVNLSVGTSTISQDKPSGNLNPTPIDKPVIIESVVLENGKELFVTSRRPEVTNPNPLLGTEQINRSAVEIIHSSGPNIMHPDPEFTANLVEVISTPDLRSYWSIGTQPSIPNGESFVDLIYPFPSSGYILISERNGNSSIDFVALGVDGKPIPGAATVQVRGYQWDTGVNHATDNPSQKQWLVVFSASLFNTLQPINGVRIVSINEPDGKLIFFVGNLSAAPDQTEPINNLKESKAVLNVLDNDELNEAPIEPFDVELSVITPFPDNSLIFNADGTVDVPASTPPGIYTMTYKITDIVGGESDQATVTVRVFDQMPEANDDNGGNITVDGADAVVNVLENDLINGEAAMLEKLLLSEISNDTKGILTLQPDGTVDVAAGAKPGVYQLTYQICDKSDPSKCDTATVSVFIEITDLLAVDDNFGSYNQNGVIGNVLLNDKINGIPVSPNLVEAVITDDGGLSDLVIAENGNLSLPTHAAPGNYTVVYKLSETLNPSNSDTATIRFTVKSSHITLINDLAQTNQNKPIDIAVLDNDTSESEAFDLNTLKVTIPPANGTATVNQNGTISYTPDSNFTGEEGFTYSVCDNQNKEVCGTALVTVTVRPIRIELVKTVDKTKVPVGETITYTLNLTNNSAFDVEDILLKDVLPESLLFVSSSPAPTADNTWIYPSLAAGESVSMTIEALTSTTGEVTNTATASIGDYQITAQSPPTAVGSLPIDLTVSKTSFGAEIFQGNEFEYEILVKNVGNTDATEVIITDNLPPGLSYVTTKSSASAEGIEAVPSINGQQVIWSVSSLPAGQFLTLHLTARADQLGSIINHVEVTSTAQEELTPENNQAQDVNEVLEFFIPNVITPGAKDHKNDHFVIRGIERFPSNRLVIFNRWGDPVFEADDYKNNWSAEGVSMGSYFYTLEVTDSSDKEQIFKGWIQVIKD